MEAYIILEENGKGIFAQNIVSLWSNSQNQMELIFENLKSQMLRRRADNTREIVVIGSYFMITIKYVAYYRFR